jgi:hypothetical protein
MTHNTQLYVLCACITYAVLYITIAYLTTRYRRTHQYRHKDDVDLQCRDTAKEQAL